MRVLVTGGAGFIGSHLVDAYLAVGDEVAVVDDLSSGRRENLNPAARFHELDICDPRLDEVITSERPQLVAHLAAQIDVSASVRDPESDLRTNVTGTVRLLAACLRHGVETFVFASTGGAVYGEPDVTPVPESAPIRPMSPYGIHKYVGELYVQYCEAIHGLRGRIVRGANVYGPRQHPRGEGAVVAVFATKMLAGQRPRIFGDGTQQRDFVYVGDMVEAFMRAPSAPSSTPINIGTGELTSVNELFRAMAGLIGFDGEPIRADARPGEVYASSLDPTFARKAIGWVPRTPLVAGLERTVEFFRNRGCG